MRPYYYLGEGKGLTQLSNGLPFFVNTKDEAISTWIILGGTWENFVDDILCGITRPGDNVLDAGANQGYYSVKLSNIIGPDGNLFAFEPNPEVFRFLESNIYINGFTGRARIFQKALGSESGKATLNFSFNNIGGGTIVRDTADGENSVAVEIVRGDDLIPEDIKFDVFKFDVEGSEPAAAVGLEKVLARSDTAAIVIEIFPGSWAHSGDFDTILKRFTRGYRVGFEIHHDGSLEPLDLTRLSKRADTFYALLLPPDHWAMNFARERCRQNSAGQ